MTACFTCDYEGCGAHAKQGTITGGIPSGWALEFELEQVTEVVKEKGGTKTVTKMQTHTKHYCKVCRPKRAAEREAERAERTKGKKP